MEENLHIDVIILNGASSSGKTSIAKQLQAILPENYLHIGIDTFIAMMALKTNQLTISDKAADGFYFNSETVNGSDVQRIRSGEYGKRVNKLYHSTVKHFVDSGFKVIVDDVMDGKSEQDAWRSLLGEAETLYIGVECSSEVLAERERCRKDRIQGSAQEQAERVHDGVKYDLIVSTTTSSVDECAQAIAAHKA